MENMEKVVYLDNAATTPCAPEALEMMVKALSGACGNPSSHYSVGYEAKEVVDTGREMCIRDRCRKSRRKHRHLPCRQQPMAAVC